MIIGAKSEINYCRGRESRIPVDTALRIRLSILNGK